MITSDQAQASAGTLAAAGRRSLRAVAEDGDLAGLDQAEVGIGIVEHGGHGSKSFQYLFQVGRSAGAGQVGWFTSAGSRRQGQAAGSSASAPVSSAALTTP